MADTISATAPTEGEGPRLRLSPSLRSRILLSTAVLVSFAIAWFMAAVIGFPHFRGFEASLFTLPGPVSAVLVVAVVAIVNVVVGTFIAGSIRFDAGLFAACLSLSAFSYRGGPIRYVLQSASSPSIYITLMWELILLYVIIAIASTLQSMFGRAGMLLSDSLRDSIEDTEHPILHRVTALLVQIVVMGLLMAVLAQTDRKNQAIFSVAAASFGGAVAAYHVAAVRPSGWYWVGPLVVGVAGYAWGYSKPGDWVIGRPGNPLAAPLPLDYASAGPAFAILGYWMSRRWRRERESGDE
jgi:hypothetical protein